MNFIELRGLVMTATGWTPEQFNNAPLPAVFDLLEYWAEHPPEHIIAAAVAGIKPKEHRQKKQKKERREPMTSSKKPTINPYNPEQDAALPDWVQQARKMERERRLQEAVAVGK